MKIIIKDGKKYVETSKGGLELACVYDGCDFRKKRGKYGEYCIRHYKIVNNEINGKIIIKDSKRYIEYKNGKSRLLCCNKDCIKCFNKLEKNKQIQMEKKYTIKKRIKSKKTIIIKEGVRYD